MQSFSTQQEIYFSYHSELKITFSVIMYHLELKVPQNGKKSTMCNTNPLIYEGGRKIWKLNELKVRYEYS